jgi:sterol desaturase/sphingolipid hydroxylase (fatty acid hydroxylase superfamily)
MEQGLIMEWKVFALLGSLFLFGILEHIYPFFSFKQRFTQRVAANIALGILNILVTSVTTTVLLAWVWQQSLWQGIFHGIHSPILVFVLSFFCLDAYMYGWHRFVHSTAWGWRFHQVHHSDWAMNVSTTYRFHPVEVILSNIPKIILIGFLGIPPICVVVYETLYAVQLIFEHSNWKLDRRIDRVLSYFIVTPNYHRLHHSKLLEHSDSNYASFLTIWDWIGRSQAYPEAPEAIHLGVDQPVRNDAVSLVMMPFVNRS